MNQDTKTRSMEEKAIIRGLDKAVPVVVSMARKQLTIPSVS